MARRGCLAAVAVILAIAASPASAPAAHYESPAEMSLRSCTEHVGSFLVPREAMKRHLAPGFTFGYFPAELAALDPGGQRATLIVIAVRCDERLVEGVPTPPGPDALAVVVVNPPAALSRPGASFHAVGVHSMVDRGEVEWGEQVLGAGSPLGGVRLGHDRMRHGAAGMKLLTIAGGAVAAPAGHWRLFRTHDGQVLDATDVDATSATDTQPGVGTLLAQGIPGVDPVLTGFGIHEWDLDVELRPVPLP